MRKVLTVTLGVATLVAALSSIAAADPVPASTQAMQDVSTMIRTTTSFSQPAKPATTPDKSDPERPFQPDYTNTLTPQQMQAAWESEIERVFVPPIGGGG